MGSSVIAKSYWWTAVHRHVPVRRCPRSRRESVRDRRPRLRTISPDPADRRTRDRELFAALVTGLGGMQRKQGGGLAHRRRARTKRLTMEKIVPFAPMPSPIERIAIAVSSALLAERTQRVRRIAPQRFKPRKCAAFAPGLPRLLYAAEPNQRCAAPPPDRGRWRCLRPYAARCGSPFRDAKSASRRREPRIPRNRTASARSVRMQSP